MQLPLLFPSPPDPAAGPGTAAPPSLQGYRELTDRWQSEAVLSGTRAEPPTQWPAPSRQDKYLRPGLSSDLSRDQTCFLGGRPMSREQQDSQ